MDNLKTLKKITPHFVLDLVGRYKFITKTESFSKQPIRSVCKLGRWMVFVWTKRDISFDTPDGTHFISMTQNLSSFIVYFDNYRDRNIYAFLVRYLKQGFVFVDAGANIGTYTVRASPLVGAQGKVIAIEAHPLIYDYLRKNIELNNLKNVVALHLALGSKNSSVEMSYNPSNAGETHVVVGGEKKTSVRMQTLDDILQNLNVSPVDYLKIDVEGFEFFLLTGAEKTIKNSPRIVVQTELNETHSRRYGRSIVHVIDFLYNLGLSPHEIKGNGDSVLLKKSDIQIPSDVLWWHEESGVGLL
jgi:FkbM family methyltransferase